MKELFTAIRVIARRNANCPSASSDLDYCYECDATQCKKGTAAMKWVDMEWHNVSTRKMKDGRYHCSCGIDVHESVKQWHINQNPTFSTIDSIVETLREIGVLDKFKPTWDYDELVQKVINYAK